MKRFLIILACLLPGLLAVVLWVLIAGWTLADAQVPLIGDNGILTQTPAGCPDWPGSQGSQVPTVTWHNPQTVPIYITNLCLMLSLAGNVPAGDMWTSIYRQSDMSRLLNSFDGFNQSVPFTRTICRNYAPNYFTLQPGDFLTLGGGCVAYSTVRAASASWTMNVTYSTQQPGATPTPTSTPTETPVPTSTPTPMSTGSTTPLIIPAR